MDNESEMNKALCRQKEENDIASGGRRIYEEGQLETRVTPTTSSPPRQSVSSQETVQEADIFNMSAYKTGAVAGVLKSVIRSFRRLLKAILHDTKVITKPKSVVYVYHINFSPDVHSLEERIALVEKYHYFFERYIFNGTMLCCERNLAPLMINESLNIITNCQSETIEMTIKQLKPIADPYISYVFSYAYEFTLNSRQLWQEVSSGFENRNTRGMIIIKCALEVIYNSYNQKLISMGAEKIVLHVDFVRDIVRTKTIYDVLQDCIRKYADFQSAFKRTVVGMVVITDYDDKTYRIKDVDFNSSPLSTLTTQTEKTNYIQYYKEIYNIKIWDEKQPLLIVKIIDFPNDMDSNETRLVPEVAIEERYYVANQKPIHEKVVMKTSITVEERMQRVRDLQRYHQMGKYFKNLSPGLHNSITRWFVVVPRCNVNIVKEFVDACIIAAAAENMTISAPFFKILPDSRTCSYIEAVEAALCRDPQLIMCILAGYCKETYQSIKTKCCVNRSVACQVVSLESIQKYRNNLLSLGNSVVKQMQAKLNGLPCMDLPVSGIMAVGLDVCPSTKGDNKLYAALVATMRDFASSNNCHSAVIEHIEGQEISNEIAQNMRDALKAYRNQCGCLPNIILFYRNNVKDTQLMQIGREIQQLQSMLDGLNKSVGVTSECRLAFIAMNKRINTPNLHMSKNLISERLVEGVPILSQQQFDFLLVTQALQYEATSPVKFSILFNNTGLDGEKILKMTYKLTYLNDINNSKTPVVCRYASKLALSYADTLLCQPTDEVANQLCFI